MRAARMLLLSRAAPHRQLGLAARAARPFTAAAPSSSGRGGDRAAAAAIFERFARNQLVPVVAIDDPEHAEPIARALLAGGLDVMELVLRTPAAEASLGVIAARVPEMLVGAGTVLAPAQAERAVAAGAHFLVSPGTNVRVVRWAAERGVPIVPGVATATEVEAALELGLDHLKLFPAEAVGGTALLKALAGPYAHVRFMPTGGVTQRNAPGYLALPNVFCCGGTWLVPADAVAARDYGAVEVATRAAVEALAPTTTKPPTAARAAKRAAAAAKRAAEHAAKRVAAPAAKRAEAPAAKREAAPAAEPMDEDGAEAAALSEAARRKRLLKRWRNTSS